MRPDEVEDLAGAGRVRAAAEEHQRKLDVLGDGEGRDAARTSGRRSPGCRGGLSTSSSSDRPATLRPATISVAFRGRVEAGQQIDQRRLAGPGRAEDGDDLAGADRDVHAVERLYGLAAAAGSSASGRALR